MANQVVWNWRVFFQCDDLNTAERNINKKDVVTGFEVMDDGSINAEVGLTSSRFHTRISGLPTSYSSCVKINAMNSKQRDISKWTCDCSKRMTGKACVHLALLALYYEKTHGALTFTETAEEAEARIAEEKRKKEKEREQKRRDGLLEEVMPVTKVLPNLPDSKYFFDMKNILGECKTNALEVERLEGYRSKESDFRFYTGFTRTGVQCLSVLGEVGGMKLDATLPRKGRPEIRCSCGLYCRQSYYFSSYRYDKIDGMSYLKTISGDLCGHKLLLLEKTGEYVQEYDPGDETDMIGMNFMKNVIEKSIAKRNQSNKSLSFMSVTSTCDHTLTPVSTERSC